MKKRSRLEIIIPMVVLGLCVISVLFVNTAFKREEGNRQAEVIKTQNDESKNDFIEVDADVLVVDPINDHMLLRLSFKPHGRFDAGNGLLSVPLLVEMSDLNGTRLALDASRRMFARDVQLDLHQGEVEDYPFDEHHATFEVLILEQTKVGGWSKIPLQLNFIGAHHGYVFNDSPLPSDSNGYLGLEIGISRSPLVIWTAIFCMGIIWGLTIVNLFLLWTVITGRLEVDLGLFGYMSGFIVAMYFFRQILPDVPPFLGVYADYLAFFWAELIAAGISIIFAMVWFKKMARQE